jgi:hypothetical protein
MIKFESGTRTILLLVPFVLGPAHQTPIRKNLPQTEVRVSLGGWRMARPENFNKFVEYGCPLLVVKDFNVFPKFRKNGKRGHTNQSVTCSRSAGGAFVL